MALLNAPEARLMNDSVGLVLWYLRAQAKLDLWTAAEQIGLPARMLKQCEHGAIDIPAFVIGRACAFYNCKADAFFLPYHEPELFELFESS